MGRTTRSCIPHSCLLCVGLAGCSRDLAAWTGRGPSSQGPGGEVPPLSHMAARDRTPPSDPCGGYILLRETQKEGTCREGSRPTLGGSPEGSLVHAGGVKRSGSGRSARKRLSGDTRSKSRSHSPYCSDVSSVGTVESWRNLSSPGRKGRGLSCGSGCPTPEWMSDRHLGRGMLVGETR